jgi:hypothetical protein
LTAPSSLGTQADLELIARELQICTDEIRTLIGHRPRRGERFTWVWVIDDSTPPISYASPRGVTTIIPSDWELLDETRRAWQETLVARGACFGPHEITHVITADSGGPRWADEGIATLTDRFYESGRWRCCATHSEGELLFSCQPDAYTYGLQRRPYADLSPFSASAETYNTAACFWLEIYNRGGFPALRRVLASMRADAPLTTGELVLHNANPALAFDLRPMVRRHGFTDEELVATGPALAPAPPTCAAGATSDGDVIVGTIRRDVLVGTPGKDFICALQGADRLEGGGGDDVLQGMASSDRLVGSGGRDRLLGGDGSDLLLARDRVRDEVVGGAGLDRACVDRRLDRIAGVERVVRLGVGGSCGKLAGSDVAPTAGTAGRPPTLVVAAGPIAAVAQDGPRVAWASREPANRRCPFVVRIRDLARGTERQVTDPRGPTCRSDVVVARFGPKLALAGGRALWTLDEFGNSRHTDVVVGSVGARDRRVEFHQFRIDDFSGVRTLAGDGATLAYGWVEMEYWEGEPCPSEWCHLIRDGGVERVVGTSAPHVRGVRPPAAIAVSGNRLAVIPRGDIGDLPDQATATVEVRTVASGALLRRIRLDGEGIALALSGDTLAVLVGGANGLTLASYSVASGRLVQSVETPGSTAPELSASSAGIVSRVDRSIRLLQRSGAQRELAVAAATPIGLSIEGSRVVWAENVRIRGRTRGRIRAVSAAP